MEIMKFPKLFCVFSIFTCAAIYAVYTKWNFDYKGKGVDKGLEKQLGAEISRKDEAVLYGIMFDAGSTGTRIHVFQFAQKPKELPRLIDTTFKALKPGLSAYADNVDKSTEGINELLAVAKEAVPMHLWKSTPLVLKATAGLRLLPGEKAQKLLDKVKDIFQESPFFIGNDCVSIMDGSDEGISAWITVNFLTESLNNPTKKCVGMLDLGGGSTQITFRPSTETSVENTTAEHIISFNLFNTTYKLNSHSYLGFGLMSARLAILGGVEGQALKEGEELISPCLPLNYQGEWEHAKILYKIKGQKPGRALFESCHNEISKVLNKNIHETARIKDLDFYAFSYYYELAVDAGLIDKKKGGILPVRKFESAAKKVCKTMEIQQGKHPFLCMDLTYISLLLKELGFPKNHILKLAQKINNIETSWALGAILHYMDSLHML
ncbi:ectonucleoside triphosphate diphosphohydrolase 6 isoform X1 [Thamnophis elegans]|uniref:ectonucleoside triphosphate diphosphohydrolase 6 isoform X1 n=1 Tax=Thamnophis elegans TaxID=35005 RepID=UPI001377EADA|nr:ectonucleoside triphosphate diphosphohydrolase 6 isoform X1 [Thamnophis elegans]XP_032072391.1 ectonucleoside triphosphate diphosphohydrolase 6 isoform X1 [Thamnophis elegans]